MTSKLIEQEVSDEDRAKLKQGEIIPVLYEHIEELGRLASEALRADIVERHKALDRGEEVPFLTCPDDYPESESVNVEKVS